MEFHIEFNGNLIFIITDKVFYEIITNKNTILTPHHVMVLIKGRVFLHHGHMIEEKCEFPSLSADQEILFWRAVNNPHRFFEKYTLI